MLNLEFTTFSIFDSKSENFSRTVCNWVVVHWVPSSSSSSKIGRLFRQLDTADNGHTKQDKHPYLYQNITSIVHGTTKEMELQRQLCPSVVESHKPTL